MLAALALAAVCAAPAPIALSSGHSYVDAGVEALVLPGAPGELAAVRAQPACREFEPITGQPNFGASKGSAWLRFVPAFPDRDAWFAVVRFVGLEQLCFHWPVSGTYQADCVNRKVATDRKRMRHGRILFPVPADLSPDRPVYVQAQGDLWLKVPLELASAIALLDWEESREYAWGLYFGLLGTLIVISVLMYLGRPDRANLYFALHIAVLTFALGIWQGRFVAFDFDAFSWTRIMPSLVALYLAFGSKFYQHFLDTRAHVPVAHRLFQVVFVVGLVMAPAQWVFPVLVTQVLGLCSLIWLVCILGASAQRARVGYRPALWGLAAGGVMMAAVFLNALTVLRGFLWDARLTLEMAYLGNLLSAAFLLFGLVYRVRTLVEDRDRATALAQANQKLLVRRAQYDELTGLPNRAKLRAELQDHVLGAASGTARRGALFIAGLNRFRAINHALSYEGGDAVLEEVAGRMRELAVPEDLLARIGPATFAWLCWLPDTADRQHVSEQGERLRRVLSMPLLRGRGAALTIAVGAATFPDDAVTAELLLRCSDEAYYRAKERGGALEIYQPGLHEHAQNYLELNKNLRAALARNELDLHFQPLCGTDPVRPLGCECLLRWRHEGVYVPPERFLPVAESADLIVPLTDWVFYRACLQQVRWRAAGIDMGPLYVNVSASQFHLPDLSGRVRRALAEAELPGSALVLEITESMLLEDLEQTQRTLFELREVGVGIAVDDFGVGYSSLSYLRSLPVHSIKIDRSFLRGVPEEPEAAAVINAVIALGRELNLTVIAEGIESQVQQDFLAERGVDLLQGFHLARPMSADDAARWYVSQHAPHAAA